MFVVDSLQNHELGKSNPNEISRNKDLSRLSHQTFNVVSDNISDLKGSSHGHVTPSRYAKKIAQDLSRSRENNSKYLSLTVTSI